MYLETLKIQIIPNLQTKQYLWWNHDLSPGIKRVCCIRGWLRNWNIQYVWFTACIYGITVHFQYCVEDYQNVLWICNICSVSYSQITWSVYWYVHGNFNYIFTTYIMYISQETFRRFMIVILSLVFFRSDPYSLSLNGKPTYSLQWHHNGHNSVSNHQPYDCLLNRLFRRRSKKISKLRVTGLWVGN